jgi:hypothetical protein
MDIVQMHKSLEGEGKIPYKIIFYILKEVYDFFVESDRMEKSGDSPLTQNIVITTSDLAGDYGNNGSTPRKEYA